MDDDHHHQDDDDSMEIRYIDRYFKGRDLFLLLLRLRLLSPFYYHRYCYYFIEKLFTSKTVKNNKKISRKFFHPRLLFIWGKKMVFILEMERNPGKFSNVFCYFMANISSSSSSQSLIEFFFSSFVSFIYTKNTLTFSECQPKCIQASGENIFFSFFWSL